jgi:nucleoside-diphosphate-sugar epimerase
VYGPFSKNWSVKFATMFLGGFGALYERIGEGTCNLVYVDDLVGAILAALGRDEAIGEAFNVAGPEVVTWNDYFRRFNLAMGRPPLPVVPFRRAAARTYLLQPVRFAGQVVRNRFMPIAKALATQFEPVERVMKATERKLKMTPAPEDLQLFSRDAVFAGNKIRRLLGFSPAFTVDRGLEATVAWLTEQGFFLDGHAPQAAAAASVPEPQMVDR